MGIRTIFTRAVVLMAMACSPQFAHAQTQMTHETARVYHGLATKLMAMPPAKAFQKVAVSYVTDIQNSQLNELPDGKPVWPDYKIYDQVNLFLIEAINVAQFDLYEEIEKILPYDAAKPLLDRWQQPAESKALTCLILLPADERQSTGLEKCNREHGASLTQTDQTAINDISQALSAAYGRPRTNAAINGAICLAADNLFKDMSVDGRTITIDLELGIGGAPQLPCNIIKMRWAGLIGLDRVMELESTIAHQATE
jgi:hypothetical protein